MRYSKHYIRKSVANGISSIAKHKNCSCRHCACRSIYYTSCCTGISAFNSFLAAIFLTSIQIALAKTTAKAIRRAYAPKFPRLAVNTSCIRNRRRTEARRKGLFPHTWRGGVWLLSAFAQAQRFPRQSKARACWGRNTVFLRDCAVSFSTCRIPYRILPSAYVPDILYVRE